MDIRLAILDDAPAMRAIYNHEVENTTATFDLVARTLIEQREWIAERSGALGVLVAEIDDTVVGFASLSPYRTRPAYRTTVEDSIYVAQSARGAGVGRALLDALIELAAQRGFHTVIAHIAHITGRSEASVALHSACGFTTVGAEREVGRKFGRWLDVVIMQRMIT